MITIDWIPDITGIYAIGNLDNGFFYIGSSKRIRTRLREHIRTLRQQKHHNSYLQAAWNKYGEDRFYALPLQECEIKDLPAKELYFISIFSRMGKAYNLSLDTSRVWDWTGKQHSADTKIKMSKAASGEKNHEAKLTTEKVQAIRETYANGGISMKSLGQQFGVSSSTIYKIVHRKRWKNI